MARPTIEEREDGLRWLMVKEGWSGEAAGLVNSGRVDGIELNSRLSGRPAEPSEDRRR